MSVLQTHQKKPEQSGTFMIAVEVRRSDAIKTTDADFGISVQPYSETLLLIGEDLFIGSLRVLSAIRAATEACRRAEHSVAQTLQR